MAQCILGHAFLDKKIFTSYNYFSPDSDPPPFQISLSSLLETLQIFGINDIKDRSSSRDPYSGSFRAASVVGGNDLQPYVLGMSGMCRITYAAPGDPLCITLEEPGITTTCELVTYEPERDQTEIPLQRDAIHMKIIMRASWLYDAITELSSTSPTRLTVTASSAAPFFSLSASGPLGSATVEFSKDPQLLETFQVQGKILNTYKYSLVKGASRAMAIATKVSIRGDEQGVLSLQFMVENEEGGGVSFVDFVFVPLLEEEGDIIDGEEEEEEEEDGRGQVGDGFED